MLCDICGEEMVAGVATREAAFHYTMSGLRNVFLVGINYQECPACQEKVPEIPKMGELHKVIATVLIKKEETLSGEEVRYLRKNAGLNGTEFAALIGVSPEHLSRVENNNADLSASVDKMVRVYAEDAIGGGHFREVLREKARKIKKKKGADRKIFRLGGNHWEQLSLVA